MKKFLCLILITLVSLIGVGSAAAFTFNINMGSDGTISDVYQFDWAASGSGLIQGITPGQVLNVGDEFTFQYQASLVGLQDKNGQNITGLTGLNADYEYTAVASFTERVVGFTELVVNNVTISQTAFFQAVPNSGTAYVYFDDTPNANVATGFGFDDGTQVVAASAASGLTQYTYILATGQGGGSPIPEVIFSTSAPVIDENYIFPDEFISSMWFRGDLVFPAGNSATTQFFDGRGGQGNYDIIAVTGEDLMLQVDGRSGFNAVVPEPTTMILMGTGLLGLAIIGRRKFTDKI